MVQLEFAISRTEAHQDYSTIWHDSVPLRQLLRIFVHFQCVTYVMEALQGFNLICLIIAIIIHLSKGASICVLSNVLEDKSFSCLTPLSWRLLGNVLVFPYWIPDTGPYSILGTTLSIQRIINVMYLFYYSLLYRRILSWGHVWPLLHLSPNLLLSIFSPSSISYARVRLYIFSCIGS
jgi:hypothetical protein